MVVTTRSLAELRAQCDSVQVPYQDTDNRGVLMDLLRAKIGTPDLAMEIDPAKAYDLKSKLKWGTDDPYAGIAEYLTDAYVAEPKLDGVRMRLFLGELGNTMNSGRRSVKTFGYTARTDNFPHIRDAAVPALNGTILDGELLSPSTRIQTKEGDEWTDSLLNASVSLVNCGPDKSVAAQERFGKAQFWVFDVLAFRGEDVTGKSYDERRGLLENVVTMLRTDHPECEVRLIPQEPATVATIEQSLREGFEGVMLKLRSGTYRPGKRMREWLKVKAYSTADAFVVDYEPGENKNEGKVGSLELAVVVRELKTEAQLSLPIEFMHVDGRHYEIRTVAQVGNLTDEMRDAITADDGSLREDFYGTVIEFLGQGIGKNGRARHAHMERLRPDKDALDCGMDQIAEWPRV